MTNSKSGVYRVIYTSMEQKRYGKGVNEISLFVFIF